MTELPKKTESKFQYYKKVILGAALLFLGIGTYTYRTTVVGEKHILQYSTLKTVEAVGDTGVISHQRNQLSVALSKSKPDILILLGDEKYPDGIQTEEEFIKHIMEPFYREGLLILFAGGNHTQYAYQNRDFLLKLAASKKYHWFIYPYYYYGVELADSCLTLIDTAVYDVKVSSKDDREVKNGQEKFISEFPDTPGCQNKPMHLLGHHGIYASDESHGDRPDDRFSEVYRERIVGVYASYTNGHSHVSSVEKCDSRKDSVVQTCNRTVGAGSKFNVCVRGEGKTCFVEVGTVKIEGRKVELKLISGGREYVDPNNNSDAGNDNARDDDSGSDVPTPLQDAS